MSKADLLKHKPKASIQTAAENLKRLQALPLAQKIALTERRITEFVEYYNKQVYVSFSGGKDSTVLLSIVRKLYPNALIPGVFINTGIEYPEIINFVDWLNSQGNQIVKIKPKMSFMAVIKKYGYPVVSKEISQKIDEIRNTNSDKLRNKRLNGDEKGNGKISEKWKFLIKSHFKISNKCCDVMKKRPAKAYEKETGRKAIVGTMASESMLRKTQYLKKGCNSFSGKRPMSNPLSFWTEKDIWDFLNTYQIQYSKIYDMGEKRTGCMYCMYGCQFNDEDGLQRFSRMEKSHPKQFNYAVNKLKILEKISFIHTGV